MNIVNFLQKGSVHGVISVLSGSILIRKMPTEAFRLANLNMNVPLWVFLFGAGLVSSVVSDTVHNFIREEVPLGQKFTDNVSLITSGLVGGGSMMGVFYLLKGQKAYVSFSPMMVFGMGMSAEILSDIILSTWMK